MDTKARIQRVVDFLTESFSGGNMSLSKEDVIDDAGTALGDEVFGIIADARAERISVGDGNSVIEALDVLASAWSQGFELANGGDLVSDDGETVAGVLFQYLEDKSAPRA